jgi:phosphate:Na+ symporter
MVRYILLAALFILLSWGFWFSADFKTIAAGIAIFLLGMFSLEKGFKAFSGGILETFLRKTTDKTWKSVSFGFVSTTLMQSSSLVSVLTISFISAGLIALSQGIGIIFGANLGTTTGAWLVAGFGLKVDIAAYAMPMLVFGVILIFQESNTRLRGAGWALVGLGFLFLGISYMKDGFEAVGGEIDLSQFAIPGFRGLLIYTGLGIAATVIMQSSHATLILTITALAAGQVTYENALALAIGSNVGTTITAVLGAISASVAGRRLVVAHLIFNLVTGLLAILFIGQFAQAVDWLSSHVGIAADDHTLKFAVFHTLFNLAGVSLMLPLIGTLVTFLERLLREKVEPVETTRVLFLNDSALEFPDTALEVISRETIHLVFNAFEILAHGLNLNRSDITSSSDINAVLSRCDQIFDSDTEGLYQRKVKPLYSAIINFSSRAEQQMDSEQRLNIAVVLRILFKFDIEVAPSVKLEQLKQLKLQLKQQDIVNNGTLDKLIREQRISSDMATSLMNDSAFSNDIQKNLIAASETVLVNIYSTEHELQLSETELEQEITHRRGEIIEQLRQEEARIDAITCRDSNIDT